MGQIKRKRCS